MDKTISIAVVGKGGVGKSVVTTLIAKEFSENYNHRLLLIDADPSYPHLTKMVNLEPRKSLEEIRMGSVKKTLSKETSIKNLAENIDIEVYNAIAEDKRFSLFSIGQPQDPGCYCPSNALLRKVIESISQDFDIVLIDCEAGLEQISRLVLKTVDILIIVTDISVRSVNTAISIYENAKKFTNYKEAGVVINKAKGDLTKLRKQIIVANLDLWKIIPEDFKLIEFELEGKSIIELPSKIPIMKSIKELVGHLNSFLD